MRFERLRRQQRLPGETHPSLDFGSSNVHSASEDTLASERTYREEYSDYARGREGQREKCLLRSGDRINQTGMRFEDDLQDAKSGPQLFAKAPDGVGSGSSGPFGTG